ncbi:MAG: hypothetical protein QOH76_4015 [Thermoleophilaceae bacterium]|nr:hypothetical protein [Thermoleophilaceae bacterium]
MAGSLTGARKGGMTARVLGAARWDRFTRRLENFESQLVWIFGSPRSGSTWLLQLLGDHETVVPINEPLIGWYFGPFMCDLPGIDPRQLDSNNFTLRRVHQDKRPSFFAEEFEDVWRPGIARLMLERFHAHARRHPPEAGLESALVVIKEPNGSQSADVISRALPHSRFVFLLRDGRDVVDSELAANLQGSWITREFPGSRGVAPGERLEFVVQSAKKWLWRTEVVEAALAAHPGPKYLIRYEELRSAPEVHLRQLFDWLELTVSDDELVAMVERRSFEALPPEARGPKQFFRAAAPGGWRENLSEEEQSALEEVIGPKLRALGYD